MFHRDSQLVLDLRLAEAKGRENFYLSDSNRDAANLVLSWPDWPHRVLALVGPAGSGKSHIVSVLAEKTNARTGTADDIPEIVESWAGKGRTVILEDLDAAKFDETALFHLVNLALAREGYLLLTAALPPARWPVALPDLRSRLAAVPQATLQTPDDALLAAVFLKLFMDRQLIIDPRLVPFLVNRVERSLEKARATVAALDAASLPRHAALTPQFAAEVLGLRNDA